MRPAKSFWKNAQDWRTTCQWFCQRMRFDTLAAIAWLAIRFAGQRERPRHQHHQRHADEQRPGSANSVVGRDRGDQRDDAAHEHRDRRVDQRDHEADHEQRDEQPLRLPGKMPKEGDAARPAAPAGRAMSVGFNSRSKSVNMAQARNGPVRDSRAPSAGRPWFLFIGSGTGGYSGFVIPRTDRARTAHGPLRRWQSRLAPVGLAHFAGATRRMRPVELSVAS